MPVLTDSILGLATSPAVLDPTRLQRARKRAEEALQASLGDVAAAPAFQRSPGSLRASHGAEDSHQALMRALDLQSAALVTLSDKNTHLRKQLGQVRFPAPTCPPQRPAVTTHVMGRHRRRMRRARRMQRLQAVSGGTRS